MISLKIEGGLTPDQQGFDTQEKMKHIFEAALHLQMEKAKDYGEAYRSQGYMGNVARVLSKAARLKQMVWTDFQRENADEPVDDSLLDLINIACFALINRRDRNKWGTLL